MASSEAPYLANQAEVARAPRRRARYLPAILFIVIAWVYTESPVATSFDSGYSIHLAVSLLRQGDFALNEYEGAMPESDYRVREVEGRLVSTYPVGPSVVVAPGVAILKHLGKDLFDFYLHSQLAAGHLAAGIEKFLSSLLVSGAMLVLWFMARRELSVGGALIVCSTLAFGTSAWSAVSRGLWQHAPSMLFVTAALWCLSSKVSKHWPMAGLWVALAFAMRPTNALLVMAVTAFIGIVHRRYLLRFFLWASPVAALFIAQSLWDYGTLLPLYYSPGQSGFSFARFLDGAAGTLVSPGRGLFVYSPVLLFSLWGIWLRWRRPETRALTITLTAILVGHWLLISSWFSWWGGTVYGPRLFADLLPILGYFLIPAVVIMLEATQLRRVMWLGAFGLLAAWSLFVHHAGATYWGAWDWNISPANQAEISPRVEDWYDPKFRRPWDVEHHPERLWDWQDPPFLRRHTILKHR